MAFLHYEKFFTTPKDMNKEEDIAYDLSTNQMHHAHSDTFMQLCTQRTYLYERKKIDNFWL